MSFCDSLFFYIFSPLMFLKPEQELSLFNSIRSGQAPAFSGAFG